MRKIWAKIRYLLQRESNANDLSEELDTHLQMEIDANIERGMSPDEARRSARREFGDSLRVREVAHEAWLFHWLESLLQDIRYGLRQFRKAPGLFFAVLASLAIGLGANTAIFSLIDAAVLRPLPVADPDRLIQLEWQNNDRTPPKGVQGMECLPQGSRDDKTLRLPCVSERLFRALSERQTAFVSLVGAGGSSEVGISTAAAAPAERVQALYVSRNFFEDLGVPPVVGRSFFEEEDRPGAEVAVVVSHRLWSNRLGGDPAALRGSVLVNGVPARIVGVAPAGFFGLTVGAWVDVYAPLAARRTIEKTWAAPFFGEDTIWWVDPVARLAPGASAAAAATAMTPLFRNLAAETTGAETTEGLQWIARLADRGLYIGDQNLSKALWVLMLLVGVLLLIVCANVANLLLSRSFKRRRESAVRVALGAGRSRLVRQHLVESCMLAVIGGVAGLGLGGVLARSIHLLFQTGQGPGDAFAVTLDWRVSVYAAAITLVTALFCGLAPAWTGARSSVNDALKTQSRSVVGSGLRLPRLLVSVQFALSLAALVAAGLLARSFGNLYSTELGFDGRNLSYVTVNPFQAGYSPERARAYLERLEQELLSIPGVLSAAPVSQRPLDGDSFTTAVNAPDGPPKLLDGGIVNPAARVLSVRGGPGFIETLGIPLLTGRTLGERDACTSFPAATGGGLCPVVVDERFAEVFLSGGTPVGQRFGLNDRGDLSHEVVGLVANARHTTLREGALPTMYEPGVGLTWAHFAIRSQIDSGSLAASVRQAVTRVDPAVPLAEFHTQSGLIDRLLRTERLLALISSGFGLVALALAAVGLGGLLAYTVALQTNEIGIRMALGASARQVRRMVLGDSLRMVGAGILIGVPAAYAVGQYLESLLYGLKPLDPATVSLALAALIAIATIAALIPALRAARVNPLTALREE